MPARGRRSAKPFTRRRSAAAFRLRPPVPRMNLSPNRGREDGAAVRPGPPGVVRLRPLLAGRQDLPGWGMAARSALSGTSGVSQPVPAPRFADTFSPTSFYRRPFIGGLLPKAFFGGPSRRHGLPTPFCRRSFFGGPSLRGGAAFFCARRNGPLCPLSSLPPLRSVPSPLCPLSALSPLRSVPSPLRPLSAPSPLRSVPFPSRSCPRPLFWRGAASSLFFGPRVEKPEKLFRFVISK